MAGSVHKSQRGNGVLVLEIDNPPMNAMSREMLAVMHETFSGIWDAAYVRAIILTGRGRAFCVGADLKEAARKAEDGGGEDLEGFSRVLELVAASRVPVIAAINGHCDGGGFELALCCDLRIALDGSPVRRRGCQCGSNGVNLPAAAADWRFAGQSHAADRLTVRCPDRRVLGPGDPGTRP